MPLSLTQTHIQKRNNIYIALFQVYMKADKKVQYICTIHMPLKQETATFIFYGKASAYNKIYISVDLSTDLRF